MKMVAPKRKLQPKTSAVEHEPLVETGRSLVAILLAILLLFVLIVPKAEAATSDEQDVKTLMQKAYDVRDKNPDEAIALFKQVVELDPTNVKAFLELGYTFLDLDRYEDALWAFRKAEALEPENYKTKLQIGYILQSLGRNREAYYKFKEATAAPDPEIRAKAQRGVDVLYPYRFAFQKDPYWGEIQISSYYSTRRDGFLSYAILKEGIHLSKKSRTDVYLSVRYNNQTISGGAFAPGTISESSTVIGVGVRTRPFTDKRVLLYSEIGSAVQATSASRQKGDFRAGAAFSDSWDAEEDNPGVKPAKHSRVGDVYFEATYLSRLDRDTIFYGRYRDGVRLARPGRGYLDGYVRAAAVADTEGFFYNNLGEIGTGVSFKPDKRGPFTFRAEFVRGYYFGVDTKGPNPFGPHYDDFRISVEATQLF